MLGADSFTRGIQSGYAFGRGIRERDQFMQEHAEDRAYQQGQQQHEVAMRPGQLEAQTLGISGAREALTSNQRENRIGAATEKFRVDTAGAAARAGEASAQKAEFDAKHMQELFDLQQKQIRQQMAAGSFDLQRAKLELDLAQDQKGQQEMLRKYRTHLPRAWQAHESGDSRPLMRVYNEFMPDGFDAKNIVANTDGTVEVELVDGSRTKYKSNEELQNALAYAGDENFFQQSLAARAAALQEALKDDREFNQSLVKGGMQATMTASGGQAMTPEQINNTVSNATGVSAAMRGAGNSLPGSKSGSDDPNIAGARRAIAAGKDRAAVIQRLRENGYTDQQLQGL